MFNWIKRLWNSLPTIWLMPDNSIEVTRGGTEPDRRTKFNPFLAEPGTHPHDGTVTYYMCDCTFCSPVVLVEDHGYPLISVGSPWVARAQANDLPVFTTHSGAYANLPVKE
jgi:hypothetical protein